MGEIADMMIDAYMFGGARDDEEAMEIGLGLRRPRWEYNREKVNWRGVRGGNAVERQADVKPFFWRTARGKTRDMRKMQVHELHLIAGTAGRQGLAEKLAEIRKVIAEKKRVG